MKDWNFIIPYDIIINYLVTFITISPLIILESYFVSEIIFLFGNDYNNKQLNYYKLISFKYDEYESSSIVSWIL